MEATELSKSFRVCKKDIRICSKESDSIHLKALDQLVLIGQYANATDVAEEAMIKGLKIIAKIKGKGSKKYVHQLLNLGELQQKMGTYKKAEVNTLTE